MLLPRIFAVLLLATGCAPPPAREPPKVATAQHAAESAPASGVKSERVRSRTLDLAIEFLLPEKSTWQITHGQTWLEARQSSSASSYAFRTWRAARLVRQSECEEQARLVRPAIPIAEPESIVEQRPFAAPAGFDSKLVVGVEPTMRGVEGYALVFGSSVGFCYAAVFTTVASGGDAEQTVATRLGVAVDRVFASVKARNVDDRVPRRHLVSGPKSAPAAPSQ